MCLRRVGGVWLIKKKRQKGKRKKKELKKRIKKKAQSGLNSRVSAPIECRYQFRVRHRAFVERQIKHFQFRRRGKSHNGTFNLITQEDENIEVD